MFLLFTQKKFNLLYTNEMKKKENNNKQEIHNLHK